MYGAIVSLELSVVSFSNEFSPFFGRILVPEEGVQAFLTYLNNSGFHKGRVVYLVHTVYSLDALENMVH